MNRKAPDEFRTSRTPLYLPELLLPTATTATGAGAVLLPVPKTASGTAPP